MPLVQVYIYIDILYIEYTQKYTHCCRISALDSPFDSGIHDSGISSRSGVHNSGLKELLSASAAPTECGALLLSMMVG